MPDRLVERVRYKIGQVWSWATSAIGARIWLRDCDVVGAGARAWWRPNIQNRGRIVMGNGVRINSHWAPVELVTGPSGVIDLADGVYLNYGTLVSAQSRVRIGVDVMVGNYSIIGDTDIPGIDQPEGGPAVEARDIEIGDYAWLAARVTVLPGTRIGAGAVIAAGSVVAGEIPAGAVAGGIPARVLRASVPAPAGDSAAEVGTASGRIE
jgi:acetyltransferase-like isoleucine patch superfamily enzyme